jgi:hypothetical protein
MIPQMANQKSRLTIFLGLSALSDHEKRYRQVLIRRVVAVDAMVLIALVLITRCLWFLVGWFVANVGLMSLVLRSHQESGPTGGPPEHLGPPATWALTPPWATSPDFDRPAGCPTSPDQPDIIERGRLEVYRLTALNLASAEPNALWSERRATLAIHRLSRARTDGSLFQGPTCTDRPLSTTKAVFSAAVAFPTSIWS